MKKILLLLVSVVTLTACHHSDPKEETISDMAILCYFVADNNLEDYLRSNIETMYIGLKQVTKPATLLIYWDGHTGKTYWPNPCILKYETDGKGNINGSRVRSTTDEILDQAIIIKEYEPQVSTDPSVMAGVIKDMLQATNAPRYGMIAGSHGSGWLKYITGKNARSFGQDGNGTENTISTAEMAKALQKTNIKFDFFLFDACMMGCAEVCYDFRNVVKYMIASVLDVPAPGFPYDRMLPHLFGGTPAEYGKASQAYIDRYNEETDMSIKFGTMSVIDCDEMPALAAAVKEQLTEHADRFPGYNPTILQNYGEAGRIFQYFSFDLLQFVETLNNGVAPTSFTTQLAKTILYSGYVKDTRWLPVDGDHYCGMGMYIPVRSRNHWNEYFQTLDWYKAAGWDCITWQE